MSFGDWLKKADSGESATATPATTATVQPESRPSVAKVATVAVANASDSESAGLREAFEERAAIMEFDGGLNRKAAERNALTIVYCRSCEHWTPDTINPNGGMGRCGANPAVNISARGGGRMPPYPDATRYCSAWEAKP